MIKQRYAGFMRRELLAASAIIVALTAVSASASPKADADPRSPSLSLPAAAPLVRAGDPNPFEEAVYLYTQAYDTDLSGSAGAGRGHWSRYKGPGWLNVRHLGAESDPGWGPGDWYDCCQHVNWNAPWAKQQQRAGGGLPDVILGIGQMPSDPNAGDSWDQKLAWENNTWQREADNDPELMAYFANYAKEVDDLGFQSVIIRLGYEFDGGWNPFGNLNVMSHMPGNYIKSWQNIVKVMRANDPKHIIRGFLWNPTDGAVQINPFDYYPGDDFTDFVGFDEYDFGYNGDYKASPDQPTQAQQDAAWVHMELPRISRFADFARTRRKRVIVGEWGLWQLNDPSHPSGGDNPSYIRRMRDWMADPNNHVYAEVYFETPSDGDSSLSGIFHPTTFPKAAALYRKLFGLPAKTRVPPVPLGQAKKSGSTSATPALSSPPDIVLRRAGTALNRNSPALPAAPSPASARRKPASTRRPAAA